MWPAGVSEFTLKALDSLFGLGAPNPTPCAAHVTGAMAAPGSLGRGICGSEVFGMMFSSFGNCFENVLEKKGFLAYGLF